jgi:hypothetical protein
MLPLRDDALQIVPADLLEEINSLSFDLSSQESRA